MPKAQEIEAAMQPTKPGEGHKKERRFTVYKPTRVEREEEEVDIEVEESSEDEAAGELAKRGLGKLGGVDNNRSESDLSGRLSLVSNFSSMESLNTLDAARRLSDVGPYHYVHPHGHPGNGGPHSPRGFPGYRGRPLGPRPFPPGMSGPRPPWAPGRGSPRPRPPHFSPRGSPRGPGHYPRGRYPSPRGGRPSRPLSCPPKGPSSTASSPLGSVVIEPPMMSSAGPASLSAVESPSPSDNELTEVPFSPVTSEGKSKNGKGVVRRSKKYLLYHDLSFIRLLNTESVKDV